MKIKLLIISVLIFLIIGSAGQAVKLEEINVDLHGSNKISDGQEDRFEVTDFNNNVYGGTLTVDEGDSYVCQAKANASPQDPRIRHGDYIKIWVDYEYFDSSDLYNGKVTFKLTLPDGQVKKKVIDDSFGLDNSVSGTLRGTFRADPDTAYTYTISAERNGEKSAKDSDVIQTIQPIKFSEQTEKSKEVYVDLNGSNKTSDRKEDRFEVTDLNNDVDGGTLTINEGDFYVVQAKVVPQDPRIRPGGYINISVNYEYIDSSDLYNGKVTFKLTLPDGQVKKKVIDDSFGLDNSVSGTLRGKFRADPDTAYTYTISAERNGEKSAKDSDLIQTVQPIKFSEQTEKSKEVNVDLNGSNKTSDRKEDRFEVTDFNNNVYGGTLTIDEGESDVCKAQAMASPQDPWIIKPGDYINISVNYEYIDTSDHYNGKVTFKLTLPNGQIVEEVIDDSFGLDNSETGTLRGTFKAYPDQAYTYTISAERTGETKAKDSETIWPINVSPCNT